jgi:hypothetical protein
MYIYIIYVYLYIAIYLHMYEYIACLIYMSGPCSCWGGAGAKAAAAAIASAAASCGARCKEIGTKPINRGTTLLGVESALFLSARPADQCGSCALQFCSRFFPFILH